MASLNDDELLDALGVDATPPKRSSHVPQEERIIAGFEDILRFYQAYGRSPMHGDDRDIFERLYAVRLDQLRKLPDARLLLGEMDSPGLLSAVTTSVDIDELDGDALLTELGIENNPTEESDITVLRHVRSHAEVKVAEEIAGRKQCNDFERFKPLFDEVTAGLKKNAWVTRPFGKNASIEAGDFFVLGGLITYVAEVGDTYRTPNAETNGRLRVIYSNGTESDLLLRSLQRALYKDTEGRTGSRIIKLDAGPLFGGVTESDDIESGCIYVLRSRSSHPFVVEHRELIHKIGVTGGKVEARIRGAAKDTTYLLADVEVVATYKLHNVSRVRLENIFHRLFGAAQLDLTIEDRFGHPVKPKEWFLVPIHIIDEAVQRILDGTITYVSYDPASARLIEDLSRE
ncbi:MULTISPECIES: GIY-YIG nuclease family protein [unclassified Pseudomonas]|uniref:GIY-YIG nuclease family protein n=1 Tax=Pseudomonas sp. 13.2 TaxID=3144665 RepID=A0AAU7BMX9_9PSED|nr:GIY-YIG nuclease family protein [Pseudomonas sp. SWI36]